MAERAGHARELRRGGYERLRDAAGTDRARLVVRLAGEAGLRPSEIAAVEPRHRTVRVSDGRAQYFLSVGGEDGREAYLPADLVQMFDRYVSANDVATDERVFPVTPRRIQMIVDEVADRAASAADRPELADVTPTDLRRYYAHSLLVERGIDPSVVLAVGGWSRLGSLDGFVEPATPDEVAAAFAESGADRTETDDRFREALDRLDRAVVLFDANGRLEYANRRFEALIGRTIPEVRGDALGDLLDDASHGAADVWETVTEGTSWTGEVAYDRPAGDPVRGRQTVVPVTDGAGAVERFVATFHPTADGTEGDDAVDRRLERLGEIGRAVRAVGRGLADATSREAVFEVVCDRIAEAPPYAFAWVSEAPGDGTPVPRTWAGIDEAAVERLALDGGAAVTERALEAGTVESAVLTDDVPDDREPLLVVAVPLVHGGTVYGVLHLAAGQPRRPSDHERTLLAGLGERAGHALAAVEWKQLLFADTAVELEFCCTGDRALFPAASAVLDCTLRLDGLIPLDDGEWLLYVTVEGADAEEVLARADESAVEARLIADSSDESVLEVTASDALLPAAVVDRGGSVEELVATDGEARIVAEFAPDIDVRSLVEGFIEEFPGAEMVAKREVDRSTRAPAEVRGSLEERLTSKQSSVLRAAYHAGYFEWPRGSTAEELADSMGISSPTLHNHLRRGQQKLLAAFFEEDDA